MRFHVGVKFAPNVLTRETFSIVRGWDLRVVGARRGEVGKYRQAVRFTCNLSVCKEMLGDGYQQRKETGRNVQWVCPSTSFAQVEC